MKSTPLKYLIILLLSSSTSFAEDFVYKISLSKEKIELPYFTHTFCDVVDNRFNKEMIGCVYKGLSNKRTLADFERELKYEFIELLQNSMLYSEKSESLVLVINSIWINELKSIKEDKGMVDINFYIAQKKDTQLIILSEQQISIVEPRLDATTNHDTRIAEALKQGLYKYQITPSRLKTNEIFRNTPIDRDSIIFKNNNISKGIFGSAKNLLINKPITGYKRFKEVDYIKNKAYVHDTHSVNSIRKVFAFSNGEDIFFNSSLLTNLESPQEGGYVFYRAKLDGALLLLENINQFKLNILPYYAFGIVGVAMFSIPQDDVKLIYDLRNGSFFELNEMILNYLLLDFPEMKVKFDKMPLQVKQNTNTQLQFIKRMNELIKTNELY